MATRYEYLEAREEAAKVRGFEMGRELVSNHIGTLASVAFMKGLDREAISLRSMAADALKVECPIVLPGSFMIYDAIKALRADDTEWPEDVEG